MYLTNILLPNDNLVQKLYIKCLWYAHQNIFQSALFLGVCEVFKTQKSGSINFRF